ncbi:MAG: PHB depolymerase family esterase [Thermoanaerobaculia bacterium]
MHRIRRRTPHRAALAAAFLLAGPLTAGTVLVDAGRGNVIVRIPDTGTPPYPLVVFLHGYSSSGNESDAFFQFGNHAETAGMLFAAPDGTQDALSNRFWNATDACCNFFGSSVNDSSYLAGLVTAIAGAVAVDPHRIFFVGHSNGGFMSYRMACDHAEGIAAVVSLAGATWEDSADCTPARAVSTLQIHGTSDAVIQYGGGTLPGAAGPYPGAVETAATWAVYDGCDESTVSLGSFDGVDGLSGDETDVVRYDLGCRGAVTELWTVNGGVHSPTINDTLRDRVIGFLVGAGNRIFDDGFETGLTAAWTLTTGGI